MSSTASSARTTTGAGRRAHTQPERRARTGRLEGKTAVITGATGGIGRAACQLFCAEGAQVIGVDLDEAAGAQLATELVESDFEFRRANLSSEAEVAALAKNVAATWSTVDILYNIAGIVLGKSLAETTVTDWDRLHDINSKSVFLMMREFRAQMTNPGGAIINTSSGAGVYAIPNMSVYSATKAGVIMLSRAAAVEFAPGIRVNAILPGVIDTAMPRSLVPQLQGAEPADLLAQLGSTDLLGRPGRPEEIAAVGLFLASDDASFITGNAMYVDGGATAV